MKNQLRKRCGLAVAIFILSLFLTIIFNPFPLYSQGKIAQQIAGLNKTVIFNEVVKPFSVAANNDPEISKTVTRYTSLKTNDGLRKILIAKPRYLKLIIPLENGASNFTVLLYKVNISPNGYTLLTSDNSQVSVNDINTTINYRGIIENDPHSVVSLSFSQNETMGLISNNAGNYVLGKIKHDKNGLFMIYNDRDLIPLTPFNCATNTSIPTGPDTVAYRPKDITAALTTKCVNWYWEIDNDIFVDKGSLANVNSYMQAVFNEVATLYANDGISISLKTLYVWTTADPYDGPSTSDYLNQFGAYRTSFDGDLANLIGYKGGGGVAWVLNNYCGNSVNTKMAYSGISSTYKSVPVYSWTVECITHEEGHVLGSKHTHDCAWNGNNTQIDGCGDAAGYKSGTCPTIPLSTTTASGGGTIMSYCHLTNVGINFNLGFGPQPQALITGNINNSTCLLACNTCATPAQPGAITGAGTSCSNISQTYSVAAVEGATSYTWTLPANWTGTSATNTITSTTGSTGGVISVRANNSCGSSGMQTTTVTITPASPAQPGAISGSATSCPNTSQTYSVRTIPGATSYSWTVPSGWSGSSTTNSITTTTGSTGGNITVKANNNCGSSAAQTLSINVLPGAPSSPGSISGNSSSCPNISQTYSVTAIPGATSYSWTVPSGWSGSSTTNSITTTTGSTGGNITVKANNSCGSSAAQTVIATVLPGPPMQPGTISGATTSCPNISQTYSVTAIPGATSYSWTVPSGWSGSSTTNSITTTTGSTGGNITVKANNSCGSSAAQTIIATVLPGPPMQPGTISGATTSCPNISQTYSVTAIADATSYSWTLPSGWSGSSTTTSIIITSGSAGGTISVTANNSCGSSATKTLAVSIVSNAPALPGAISGSSSSCPNTSQVYSVATVNGATGYTWTLPPGWSGNSATNSITTTTGNTGGTISVKANNSCGSSAAQTLLISILPNIPSLPGAILGSSSSCPNISQVYSVATIAGATSYTWTVPSGWSGSSTTNSITVQTGSTGGTISVKANNSCGSSAAKTLATTVLAGIPAQPVAVNGATNTCPNISQTYSVTPVDGATGYTWTLPSGFSGSSATNSIITKAGNTGGNISVTANNSCGSSVAKTFAVSIVSNAPSMPGIISGSFSSCPNVSQTYSVTAVAGATGYTWILPPGWSGSSATNSITVLTGTTGGTISVTANNNCGSSASQTFTTAILAAPPAQPGIIAGTITSCINTSQIYSVEAVPGATSYTWSLPTGWSGNSATNIITTTTGISGGVVFVRANNGCGSSSGQSTAVVTLSDKPSQPQPITGNSMLCPNTSQTYSVNDVPGASGYKWTLPAGWSGVSATNTIVITSGLSGGDISVAAVNSCGTGVSRTLAVSITTITPSQPGVITGNSLVCQTTSQIYSVSPVQGATGYTWTLPVGWMGSSSTESITVTAGDTDGDISVIANNNCGSSNSQSLHVATGIIPATPAVITVSGGGALVCSGDSRTYSTTFAAGVTYNWLLPEGATITGGAGTNKIVLAFTNSFPATDTLSIAAQNSCGTSAARRLIISKNIPPVPGMIILAAGNAKVCPGESRSYSVVAVPGISYNWTISSGATITSGQNTNTVILTFNSHFSASVILSVKAVNACTASKPRSLTIYRNLPDAPGIITVTGGSAKVCTGDTRTYSVVPLTGLIYNWTPPPGAGIISGQGTSSIVVVFGSGLAVYDKLKVSATGACGTGNSSSLYIFRNIPDAPGSITVTGGYPKVCPGDNRIFTVPLVTGMIYTWVVPAGAVITGGQGTNSIAVNFDNNFVASALLKVTAGNNCGTGNTRYFAILKNTPQTPGPISGPASVCPLSTGNYSIAAVAFADSYLWTVPEGATIDGANNGKSINVVWGATNGYVSVNTNNACGASAIRSMPVNINCTSSLEQQPAKAQVYPNPSQGNITVRFYSSNNALYTFRIIDVTGRTLRIENLQATHGINTSEFNLGNFANGMYIIQLQSKEVKEMLQFQINK